MSRTTAAEIAARLDGKRTATGWACRCPAHEDGKASLSVTEAEGGKILVHCHAGCSTQDVVAALGLKMSDLMPPKDEANARSRIEAVYPYHDEAGNTLFEVVRFHPKDFRQRRPDGKGGWVWNMAGVNRVLYRLPHVIEAVGNCRALFLVEGEKDVAALESIGLVATCNSGGAGKWCDDYTATLTGAQVLIIQDRDAPGRRHSELVALALHDKAKSIRVIELPDRDGAKVKDAADWIAAGGTADELRAIVKATPPWAPSAKEPPKSSAKAEAVVNSAKAIELQAQFFQIGQTKGLNAGERHQAMAEATVDFLHRRGRFFYHRDFRDFDSSMFFDADRKLLLIISSDEFKSWLAGLIGINRSDRAYAFVYSRIQDEALTGNTTGLLPEAYWASRPGAVYLSNGDGHLVKITADAVTGADNGADDILFPRGKTLAPWRLVDPVDPFTACRLWRDMATAAPHGLDLFRLWVLSLPSNQRCKPPLVLSGGIGSGKTRAATGIFELYGLPPRVTAVCETGEGDFWTALDAGGLTTFDNADTKVKWLADALAAASTDGTHEKRKLYSDSCLIQQRARAWSIVTSANPTFASDAGLADRLLVVRLDRRNTDTAESLLADEIAAHRDGGLSFVAWTLAYAMADRDPVPVNLNRRHPDFAEMAVRIGRAIGREEQAVAALRAAEADKSLFNLENDDAGAGLLALMEGRGSFIGSAAELLEAMQEVDSAFSSDYWTARRLSKRLAKLWPHIEGLLAGKLDRGHGGFTTYRFRGRGDYGDYQDPFSGKSRIREKVGGLHENTLRNSPNSPTEAPRTLFDTREGQSSPDQDPVALVRQHFTTRKV